MPNGIVSVVVFYLCEMFINTEVQCKFRIELLSGAYSGVTVVVFVGRALQFLPIAIFVVVDLQKQKERPVRRYTLFTIYFREKFNMG